MRLLPNRKLMWGLLTVFFLFILAIGAFIWTKIDNEPNQLIVLQAPYGKVTISLDNYAIPHINAEENDLDAFFALGYIHAQHRFWQMELQRHIVRGSLSEIFGKKTIEQDKYFRTWGFYRSALNDWVYFDKKTQAAIASYTAGVNAYLNKGKLPIELIILRYSPKKWENIDSYAWIKMLSFQLQNGWQDKVSNYILQNKTGDTIIRDLQVDYPPFAPVVLNTKDIQNMMSNHHRETNNIQNYSEINEINLKKIISINNKIKQFFNVHDVPGKGSNNWVISGKYTTSGKPLLANDTHLELSAPNLWYFVELQGPTLHVRGGSIPGIFAPIIGHNNYIAWGITNAGIDTQDIYLLPKTANLTISKEVIFVRNDKPVEVTLKNASFGPIINTTLGNNIHLDDYIGIRWVILEPGDTTADSLLQLNYAENWSEFTHALQYFIGPSQNFVYADTSNNIGYYLPGKIPIRHIDNLRYPVQLDDTHQWQGYIPFHELPHTYNPPEGVIFTANNKIVPNDYPYKLTARWKVAPYRAARIKALLQDKQLVDIEDMKRIQNDIMSNLWIEFKPYLLSIKSYDKKSKMALQKLRSWDGVMSADSIPATLFAAWYNEIKEMYPKSPLGVSNQHISPLFIANQLKSDGKYCQIDKANNCSEFLRIALQKGINTLNNKLGSNLVKWQWGKVHYAVFNNLIFGRNKWIGWLWNRSIFTGGDSYTVNVGAYNDDFQQIAGANYRQVIDLSNLSNSEFVYPLGQSGSPFSKHYDDMLTMWQEGKYIKRDF